jgi:hypothetical protein
MSRHDQGFDLPTVAAFMSPKDSIEINSLMVYLYLSIKEFHVF